MRPGAVDVAVCVPARDERRRLPSLLRALGRQRGADLRRFSVCILFDGCEDGGEEVVRRLAADLPFPVVTRRLRRLPWPNAGRARRAAMALGAGMVGRDGLLLCTDADTVPDADWLARSAEALAEVDVVAGHIRRLGADRLPCRCRHEAYLERLHALRRTIDHIEYDPAPSHPGLGGASLGFRAPVYAALGGFRPVPFGEDVELVERARVMGWRVRHDRRVRVATSARTTGRAPRGLATELRDLARGQPLPDVPDPFPAARDYELQAQARRAFGLLASCPATLAALSAATGRGEADLLMRQRVARNAAAFVGALWQDRPPGAMIPLETAEPMLAELERRLREQVA